MCMSILPAHLVSCLRRSEEGVGSLGAGVTDGLSHYVGVGS